MSLVRTNTVAPESERVADCRRKGDHEAGAAALRVPDLHVAAVGRRTARTMASPRPLPPLGGRVAGAAREPLEHPVAHLHGDAGAAVRHLEGGPVAVAAARDTVTGRARRGCG